MSLNVNPTRFFGLGGMQEIGKSTLIIEDDFDIVIIDAGIKFANLFLTGIKGMVPNYHYLQKKQAKIRGLFITHGHEDHIGGIIYLVQEVNIKKIFAPKIAIEYLKAKFDDQKINPKVNFIEINKNDVYRFESLSIDFWTAQHSIPDAFGIRISSQHGSIMCTGDFRFDYTPIGNYTDFEKLKEIGNQKLTVLFSDSTNAMRANHSPSERDILADIEMHMRAATRKIIITAFASNLTRIKALIEIGIKLGKKILVFGRSMINGINIGRRSGYINVPDDAFLGKNLNGVEENQMLILTTGSQGEQLAALDRMSNKKHPKISIEPQDMIIFSSSPIPGNKIKIEHLINRLYKLSAIIKENGPDGYLHTSGHAYKAEHEKIFQLTKPKYFFPYHGEYRMSVAHSQTAIESGIDPKNVIIAENGQVFKMVDQEIYKTAEKIPCDPIYIDGETISRDNSRIINERQEMRENGFVFILIPIDKQKNLISGRISIITKGTFSIRNGSQIIAEIRRLCFSSVRYFIEKYQKWSIPQIKQLIKNRLSSYFHRTKRWKPVILTKIIYVDQKIDFINYFREKNTEKYVAHNLEANKFETNSKLKSLKLANTNVVIPTKGQLKQDKTKNQIDSNITILKKSIKNYSRQTQIQDFEKKVDNNIISSKKENLKTNKLEKDSRTLLKKSNKNASTIEKYSIKSAKPTSQHQVFPSSSSSKFSVTKSNNTIMNNSKITKKSGIDKNSKLKTNYENRDKIQKNNLLNLKNLSLITTKNANYSKNLQFDLIKKSFSTIKKRKTNRAFFTKNIEISTNPNKKNLKNIKKPLNIQSLKNKDE
ncbi:ribonuclease J [Mycoplasma flocculare]|uniref:Ribonuclease J n=1 Tax=Mesomycoplasma flocculare TaxID=2128 RepID=A0AAW9X9K1_MESFC|nr:ribonuclease J [Mesomycoplasma flocculare]MXR05710.1 ribonuclease J [Mesomycoplasma flocculare]MXR39296.1 ribonuclease J [Mycoplasma sp. MF12]MXR56513.1 ribonuclease J [Mesomycoplasma flocculare]